MVDSRKVRRVNGERIFLSSYKRTYLYWFKFLQECESDPTRQVDWSKYKEWGGANYILGTKFDDFWEEKWVDLFGFKKGGKPKFILGQRIPNNKSLRWQWLCHQYRDEDYIDIFKRIELLEQRRFNRRVKKKDDIDGKFLSNISEGDGEIRSRIGRYIRGADDLMNNICIGIFPSEYEEENAKPRIKPTKKQIEDRIKLEEQELKLCMVWGWDSKKIKDWLIDLREWEVYGQMRWEKDTLPSVETSFPILKKNGQSVPFEVREKFIDNKHNHKIFSSRLNGDSLQNDWDLEKFLKEIIPNDLNLQSDEEVLEYLESMTTK